MLCCWANGSLHLEGSCCFRLQYKAVQEESLLDPEDEGITILRNVGCSHSATYPQIPEELNTLFHCCDEFQSHRALIYCA